MNHITIDIYIRFRKIYGLDLELNSHLISKGGLYSMGLIFEGTFVLVSWGLIFRGLTFGILRYLGFHYIKLKQISYYLRSIWDEALKISRKGNYFDFVNLEKKHTLFSLFSPLKMLNFKNNSHEWLDNYEITKHNS